MVSGVQGAVIVVAAEVGGDVVLSSLGGTLDLTGLFFNSDLGVPSKVIPDFGIWVVGPETGGGVDDVYVGLTGPTSIGSGAIELFADSESGSILGIDGFGRALLLPDGFVSNDTLGGISATWIDETFASLGITQGSYVWSWAGDSVTLDVVPVPVPAAVWLFGSALGLLGWIRRKAA
jgi:hypothetical protein